MVSELAEMVRKQECRVSHDSKVEMEKALKQRVKIFAESIPQFNNLSQEEQVT